MVQLDATGTLAYASFLGGSGNDSAWAVELDRSGNVYIAGETDSSDFPTGGCPAVACSSLDCPETAALQCGLAGASDGFLTTLDLSVPRLVYSTYLGGSGTDRIYGLALDGAGNAYVTGETASMDFPVVNAIQPEHGPSSWHSAWDAFVSKVNRTGTALLYSTYLGGSESDHSRAIAATSDGHAFITGETKSTNFPMVAPFQAMHGAGYYDFDAFVAHFDPSGGVVYSTFLGGNSHDDGRSIDVDPSGTVSVTGETNSIDFPTADPTQIVLGGGGTDAFVSKIDESGRLLFSTYLGETGDEHGKGIVSRGEAIYVAGSQSGMVDQSTLTPRMGTPVAGSTPGNGDVFLVKLQPRPRELVADFGARGLWQLDDGSWRPSIRRNAKLMEGWGSRLAADFGRSHGLWLRDDAGWAQIKEWSSYDLLPWGDKLVAAFDHGQGLWAYQDATQWTQIHSGEPTKLVSVGNAIAPLRPAAERPERSRRRGATRGSREELILSAAQPSSLSRSSNSSAMPAW